jgi:predicted ATPase/DNA-binding SARP family transcriptional activator
MLGGVLTVAVLGRVEVRRDGIRAEVPAGLTASLLVRLALDAGRPVRADRLVADLWAAAPATRRNTLQAKVSQLRRVLGDPAAVSGGAAGYTLVVDPAAVDASEALRLAEAGAALLARGDAAGAAATCRRGLGLFGAEVLPAVGDAEWARPHRLRLEEARLRLTEDELAARLQLGAAGEVTGVLEALVATHPLRERLWALLVTALYRAGRQSDALAAHRRVSRLLAEELGVDPGPELAVLERQVLTHDRALRAPGPQPGGAPTPSTRRRPGNLPALAGPLVGRADDAAALVAALDAHRLVTVTGPAGVGKTRLAVEVARRLDAPDGAWLVRLDGARGAAELPTLLADAVPFADAADVPAGLRGAAALLLLDNCEHLVEAVAALATRVLDAAPRVRLLATSQRPLGLDGERVHVLAPLAEPDAVALFADRAAARGARLTLTPDTAREVARLCRALDHLPLAVELAAARARVLTVGEITARLADRFPLLADAAAGRPARRRTLAGALAWSYDLLTDDDRRGLWALAAFPDGATLPAVAHVLAALDGTGPDGAPDGALDTVDRLVDRSLVSPDPPADPQGATRYRLLDSVRAFARDRAAAAGAADRAADAVVGWVARLADTVAARVRGPRQAAQVAAVAAERVTVDAALHRARSRDPACGLRIAVGLGWAWVLLDDGAAAAHLRAARAAAPDAPRDLRLRALLLESWLEAMSGDLRTARTALTDATALAGDDPLAAELTRRYGGFVLLQEGRVAEAAADLERSREDAAARGDAWAEGASALLAAFAHVARGDAAAGRAACEAAIRLLEPLGDAWGLQHAEAALGRIAAAQGRLAEAAQHHARAAGSAAALGFPGAAALHLTQLGRVQHAAGDPAAAATLRRAADVAERAGDLRLLADARLGLARVLLAAGDRAGARALLEAAARWYAASGAGDDAALAADLLAAVRAPVSPA